MRKVLTLVVAVAALTGGGLAAVMATPSTGLSRTEISRAVITGGGGTVDFVEGKEAVVLKVTIEPGGTSGWHSHPDGGVFMVDKGELTNYGLNGPACTPVVVTAGQAYFVPPNAEHPHLGLNKGTEPLELTVMYFNVPEGQPSRSDAERPAACPTELN